MRIAGLVGLFKGPPQDAVGPDGRMALADHFREFRARLLRCLLVFAVAFALAVVFRHALYDAVYGPLLGRPGRAARGHDGRDDQRRRGGSRPLADAVQLRGRWW